MNDEPTRRCLKCEKPLELVFSSSSNIDDGGDLRVGFYYGSRHDTKTAMAYICDDCFDAYPHLFTQVKCWLADKEWLKKGELNPPLDW